MLKNVIVMLGNECFAEKISVILNRRISIMLNIYAKRCFCYCQMCNFHLQQKRHINDKKNLWFLIFIYNKYIFSFYFRCKGLMLLETYTALKGDDLPLPDFLEIEREVTGLTEYSMYNLSLKEWYQPLRGDDIPSPLHIPTAPLYLCVSLPVLEERVASVYTVCNFLSCSEICVCCSALCSVDIVTHISSWQQTISIFFRTWFVQGKFHYDDTGVGFLNV